MFHAFFLISLYASLSSPALAVQSFSARFDVEQQVTVTAAKDLSLNFKSENGDTIVLSCQDGVDTFAWPHLKELLNGFAVDNSDSSPNVNSNIPALMRPDFYCDTMSGNQDEAVYKVFGRLSDVVGKNIKIAAEFGVNVVINGRVRTDVVSITKLDFYDGTTLLASFSRAGDRMGHSFSAFSGVSTSSNTP